MLFQINRGARRARRVCGVFEKKISARFARSAVALFLSCAKPQIIAGPGPEPAVLLEQVRKAHTIPDTLSCDAKAFVEAPENGGRYTLHVSVKRPASLRIEAR